MSKTAHGVRCPCDRGADYTHCCGPLHRGEAAADAQALMRSRYSAYALGLEDYLLASWHPDTRPDAASAGGDDAPRWLGLTVRRFEQTDADHALVEFVARCRVGGGSAQRLHEVSRFVRENGRWYYLDGTHPRG